MSKALAGLTHDEFNHQVGLRVRVARIKANFSCDEVGNRVGVNGSTVARYENGDTPMTCVIAFRICGVIGIEMKELFK